ncbi:sensor histidine kinase [Piscinibacterium candidicorallinum]|uniref:histidine kinase n=1 Tax=Piscinibacterium candidicorallinum TaxID=1793872 RepID=A0ABV7H3Z3_9BURK
MDSQPHSSLGSTVAARSGQQTAFNQAFSPGSRFKPGRRWSVGVLALTVLIAFASMFSAFLARPPGGDVVEVTGYLRTRIVEAQLAELTGAGSDAAQANAALTAQLARVGSVLGHLDAPDLLDQHARLANGWAALSTGADFDAAYAPADRRAAYAQLQTQAIDLTKAVTREIDRQEHNNRRLQWLSAIAFLLCAVTWVWQLTLLHRRATQSAQRVLQRINEELGRDGTQAHPRHISDNLAGVDPDTAAELQQLVGTLEKILGDSEQRWRVRAQLSSDYYWETDEQHRLTYVTSGFEDKFFAPSEMLGKTRWELSPTSLSAAQWAQHQRDLSEHLPFRGLELCKTHTDGSQAWASIAGEPRFDAQGRFLGYQGVGRDISERKRREQQLQRYNAELEQQVRQRTHALSLAYTDMEGFVRNVAHDLRTPLSQVRSLIGLARAQLVSVPPGRTNFLGLAEQQADITLEMLEALLELARASSSPVQPTPVHLRTLVESCVATLEQPDPARPVAWHFSCEHTVMTDPSLLRLALMNLMSNAVKFSASADQPSVSVLSSVQPDGSLEVHVIDNGVGFDDSQASRLFKPFSRLHPGTEFSGTGIGLSVVSKVMERLGGRAGAESTPGLGARFTLGLPPDALVADNVRPIRRAAPAPALAEPLRA